MISATVRAPVPEAGHCWPMPPQETFKYSKAGLSQSPRFLSPGMHNILFKLSECLWLVWGLVLNVILPLLPSFWGFSFALGCGISFFMPTFSYWWLFSSKLKIWSFHRRWGYMLLLHHLARDLLIFSFVKCIGILTAFISYLSLTFFLLMI